MLNNNVMLMFYSVLVQCYYFLTYITCSCVGTNCFLLKYLGIKALSVQATSLPQDSCFCRESFCDWYMFNIINLQTMNMCFIQTQHFLEMKKGLYLSVFGISKYLRHLLQLESFLYMCVAEIILLVTMVNYPYLE